MTADRCAQTAATIAIIGSGPGAVYALAHLLRAPDPLAIDLFEAGAVAGTGMPYDARRNSPAMLANIASVELPPVRQTLLDWLTGLPPAQLDRWEIGPAMLNAREFFPRVVLGAYFQDQLTALVAQAPSRGHRVRVRTLTPVLDVAGQPGSVFVRYRTPDGRSEHALYDFGIVVTGHQAPRRAERGPQPDRPYQLASGNSISGRLGILGSSLSAIDVAVAHASALGEFTGDIAGLRYVPSDPAAVPAITMLSRGGLLPEADFYCPIPYLPLELFTPAASAACVVDPAGGLDRLFDLFKQQLAMSAPDYARQIGLEQATTDDFASRYFNERKRYSPFDWAARNLAEVLTNRQREFTVAWRYALLRMHEQFGELARRFTPADLARFNAGLKRCFVDNYAAVPPLSIARILALHRAGMLAVAAVSADYELSYVPGPDDAGHTWQVRAAAQHYTFDHLIDATGQGALALEDFPFPTLRMQIRAGYDAGQLADAAALQDIAVEDDFEITRTLDDTSRIYCLSLPFLLRANPFIQGLTASASIGETVAAAITARIGAHDEQPRQDLRELIDGLAATQPIFCVSGDAPIAVLERAPS